MVLVFTLLLFSLLLASCRAQCNYAACRSYCNSSRACFGQPCPNVLSIGQRVTVFFNWSTAKIGWTAGVSPDQLYVQTVLDLENYRRMLNNQTYAFDYQSVPRVFSCQIDRGGASQGRGWALVFTCMTPVCDLWHESLGQNLMDPCAENCTTGTVGDGECNPACNVNACAFDLGDCQPRPTTSANSDQDVSSASTNPDQGMSSASSTCSPGCESQMLDNGLCNPQCNNAACSYDGGDCSGSDPCAGNPCLNGGTCSVPPGSPSFDCECIAPYCGTQCQHTVWTQASLSRPSDSFCMSEYIFCQSAYNVFSLCCYGSVSSCSGSAVTLGNSPPPLPPPPSPNSARTLELFF